MKGLPINSERLQWCLRHYCLTLDGLAKRAGLRPAALRRACESGPGLTVRQMRALTEALDFDMSFFMRKKNISKDEVRMPRFRAAAGQPRRSTEMMLLLSRVDRHRRYFESLFEDFPALRPRKTSYPQLRAGDGYVAKARAVRRWLKLSGGAGFAELRQKVEAKGVLVFVGGGGGGRWQAPKDGRGREQFKGFALRREVLPIIFVAKERDERSQSFTLLHELAHLIMHQKDAIDGEENFNFLLFSKSRREIEANALASHVLLPERALRTIDAEALEEMEAGRIDRALKETCDRHCVNTMVVLARLLASRLISTAVVHSYFMWSAKASRPQAGRRASGNDPAAAVREIFGDRYVDMVLKSAAAREITIHDALVYLDVDLDTYDMVKSRQCH